MLLAVVDRFDMPAPTMTPELKRDLQLLKVMCFSDHGFQNLNSDFNSLFFLQLRNVMDPKKHYKRVASSSKLAEKYFQASL